MYEDLAVPDDKNIEVRHKGRSVTTLHEYLRTTGSSANAASKLLSDLCTARGVGEIFVAESNSILYYYGGDKIYHTFSRGGRLVVIMARPSIALTTQRKKIIKKRFLLVDDKVDSHLVGHFDSLLKLSGSRNFNDMTAKFISGEFVVHMRDLINPFIEVGKGGKGEILVVPLKLISSLAAVNVLPHTVLEYMGQRLILATNEDYTIRVIYASHILEDKLFTQYG